MSESNEGPKAAVARFLSIKKQLMDFEAENEETIKAYHAVVDEYNTGLGDLDTVLRTSTVFDGHRRQVEFDGGISVQKAVFVKADPAILHRHVPTLYQDHPDIVKSVRPGPLLAYDPGLFDKVPDAVAELDTKVVLALVQNKTLSDEAALAGIWSEEQTKIFKPKPINLRVG